MLNQTLEIIIGPSRGVCTEVFIGCLSLNINITFSHIDFKIVKLVTCFTVDDVTLGSGSGWSSSICLLTSALISQRVTESRHRQRYLSLPCLCPGLHLSHWFLSCFYRQKPRQETLSPDFNPSQILLIFLCMHIKQLCWTFCKRSLIV